MENILYNTRTGIKFNTGWQPTWTPSFSNPRIPKIARPWQNKALQTIWDKPFTSVYAPPATGKGVFICINAQLTLEKYPEMRAVIVAPQRNITKDLKQQCFIHPTTSDVVNWKPFCYLNDTSENTQSNTLTFREWSSKSINEYSGVNDRICIMTHASLCRIFSNGDSQLFKDMILFLDEYHHVFLSNDVSSNKIGEVVKFFIQNQHERNLKLCMLTATPFRGDRMAPIPDEEMENFVEFEHPMDEAKSDFAPLQWFGLDFILYKTNWKRSINHLLGDKIKPSLFYIPNVNSPYSIGNKNDDVMEIYKAISGNDDPKPIEKGAFTLIWSKKENRYIRCIDLVNDKVCRKPKLKVIGEDHDADKSNIDVIIALDMFVEGSNWRWLQDVYIVGNHNSLREFIQMYGRPFRSAPGKTNIHCYYLLAHSSEYNTEEYVDNFNDYLKAIFATLILVDVLQPHLVSTLLSDPDKQGRIKVNYLTETFSETEFQRYIEKSQKAMLKVSIENDIDINLKEGKTNITSNQMETLKSSLDNVLDEMGIINNRQEIKNETIRLFKITSIIPLQDLKGMDVSKIDYNFIDQSNIHPLTCMISFGSGMRDVNTLKEFRKIIDAYFAQWDEMYNKLVEYKNKNGHCNVSAEDGILGIWCSNQRRLYKNKKLSSDCVNKLEKINFLWDMQDYQWQKMYNKLAEYKNKHGHCIVSRKENTLGVWVNNQRMYYKNKELSTNRINKLNIIGFSWDIQSDNWNEMYEKLCKFKNENCHCNVSYNQGSIGMWVHTQRITYKNNKLSQDRVDKLNIIGFVWESDDYRWEEIYGKLLKYTNKHGHCNVSGLDGKLGRWISHQREYYKNNKLSQYRIDRLKKLGIIWEFRDNQWNKMFNELLEYKNKHGHCSVSTLHKGLENLGKWVSRQRTLFKITKLSKDRIDKLNEIGFQWKLK